MCIRGLSTDTLRRQLTNGGSVAEVKSRNDSFTKLILSLRTTKNICNFFFQFSRTEARTSNRSCRDEASFRFIFHNFDRFFYLYYPLLLFAKEGLPTTTPSSRRTKWREIIVIRKTIMEEGSVKN